MPDSTLTAFADDDGSKTQDGKDSAAARDNAGKATGRRAGRSPAPTRDDIPKWGPETKEFGVAVKRFTQEGYVNGDRFSRDTFAWVTGGGIEAYCAEYGTQLIRIPNSYSSFDEFDGYIHRADGESGAFGYGIGPDHLEKAMRILTGGGRYNQSRYRMLACGKHPAVLTGPDGTLLVSLGPVGRLDTTSLDATEITVTTADNKVSYHVYESNPDVRQGLTRFIRHKLEAGVEYESVTNTGGEHYQLKEDNDSLSKDEITGQRLARLGRLVTNPSEIEWYDGGVVTDPSGCEHEVSWRPSHTIGEELIGASGTVIGYEPVTRLSEGGAEWIAEVRAVGVKESYTDYDVVDVAETVHRTILDQSA